MPSMRAVLEARQKAAARRVEELEAELERVRAALAEAEDVLRRRVIGLEQRAACQPSCVRVATPARLIRPWIRRWTVRLLTRSCPAIASSVIPATIRESR